MRSAAFFLVMWLVTLAMHRWFARHPEWDTPTDKGLRLAIASGCLLLPVAAFIAVVSGQP